MNDIDRLTALLMAEAGQLIEKNGTLNCSKLAEKLIENGVVVTDSKRNVPMCGTTNLPCSYCAPTCGARRE